MNDRFSSQRAAGLGLVGALLVGALVGGCTDLDDYVRVVDLQVVAEPSGDGALGPGERGLVTLRIRNRQEEDFDPVYVRLESGPWVTVLEPNETTCPIIPGGATINCGEFEVIISPQAPVPGPVTVNAILDAYEYIGETTEVGLVLVDHGAGPSLEQLEVVEDDNDDGKLSPGENALVRVRLNNLGLSALLGATARLVPDVGFEVSDTSARPCDDLAPGASGFCGQWAIAVQAGHPSETPLTGTVRVSDGVRIWELPLEAPVAVSGPLPRVRQWRWDGDQNSDAVVNIGESGELVVEIVNDGVETLTAGEIRLDTAGDDVASAACPAIERGESAWCGGLVWKAPETAGTAEVALELLTGTTWPLAITVPVIATAGRPVALGLDSAPTAGASSSVSVTVYNAGTTLLPSLRMVVLPQTDGVTASPGGDDTPVACPQVPPGAEVSCGPVTLTVPETTETVVLDVRFTEGGEEWFGSLTAATSP